VTDDFGVAGGFLQGRNEELGGAHDSVAREKRKFYLKERISRAQEATVFPRFSGAFLGWGNMEKCLQSNEL
jgi:hypothetical protein